MSDAACTCQRYLQVVLYPYPTTAHSAQFDLLCHQPEPFPRTLTTRMPHLPTWYPCGLWAWLGDTSTQACATALHHHS